MCLQMERTECDFVFRRAEINYAHNKLEGSAAAEEAGH